MAKATARSARSPDSRSSAIQAAISGENAAAMSFARDYRRAGYKVVASSGDSGFDAASFPANLAAVTAVGGTSLHEAQRPRLHRAGMEGPGGLRGRRQRLLGLRAQAVLACKRRLAAEDYGQLRQRSSTGVGAGRVPVQLWHPVADSAAFFMPAAEPTMKVDGPRLRPGTSGWPLAF
jgi:hypothetical protein